MAAPFVHRDRSPAHPRSVHLHLLFTDADVDANFQRPRAYRRVDEGWSSSFGLAQRGESTGSQVRQKISMIVTTAILILLLTPNDISTLYPGGTLLQIYTVLNTFFVKRI